MNIYEDHNDNLSNYQDSFRNMKGNIHVLERSVPVDLQMEYFRSSKDYKRGISRDYKATDEECADLYAELVGQTASEEPEYLSKYTVRNLLIKLASSKNPKAYTYLKQYVEQHPEAPELDWACLALMEIQMGLESELSDEKQIYIATGLGGRGEKLRFCVLMFSATLQPFEVYQRQVIEREFGYYFPKADCEMERLEIGENYVNLSVLFPLRSDIRLIMAQIITTCNEYGNFLADVYTITNVKEFTPEDIEETLRNYAQKHPI